MTDIAPLGQTQVGHAAPVGPATERARAASLDGATRREADQVEVSPQARYLSMLREIDPYRQSLVDEVKAEIDAGRYENEERLNGAIDALFEEEPWIFE